MIISINTYSISLSFSTSESYLIFFVGTQKKYAHMRPSINVLLIFCSTSHSLRYSSSSSSSRGEIRIIPPGGHYLHHASHHRGTALHQSIPHSKNDLQLTSRLLGLWLPQKQNYCYGGTHPMYIQEIKTKIKTKKGKKVIDGQAKKKVIERIIQLRMID